MPPRISMYTHLYISIKFDLFGTVGLHLWHLIFHMYLRFSVLRGRLRRVSWVWRNPFASLEVCLWKSQGCIFWGLLHLPCEVWGLCACVLAMKKHIKICNPRNWRLRQFVGTPPTTTSLLLDLDLVRFPFSLLKMFSHSHSQSSSFSSSSHLHWC